MKECSWDPGIFLSTASQENVRNPPISIKNNFVINSAWMFAITNVTKTSLNRGKCCRVPLSVKRTSVFCIVQKCRSPAHLVSVTCIWASACKKTRCVLLGMDLCFRLPLQPVVYVQRSVVLGRGIAGNVVSKN